MGVFGFIQGECMKIFKGRGPLEDYPKGKRFEVLVFPGLNGNPNTTDSYTVAWLLAFWKSFISTEARIIDRATGDHYIF